MRREIVIDTETTGLEWPNGDRIVEICAIELVNFKPTGRKYHRYLNPQRNIPTAVYNIHGLTVEFLSQFPIWSQIADEFLWFIHDAKLIAHNSAFDIGFINAEFGRIGRPNLWHEVTDTLALARQMFPGSPASLDALARRFGLSLDQRTMHGADIDCALLADIYVELCGGRAPELGLPARAEDTLTEAPKVFREPRPHPPLPAEEIAAHAAMLAGAFATMNIQNPIWLQQ